MSAPQAALARLARYARAVARQWRAEDLGEDITQQAVLVYLERGAPTASNNYLYRIAQTAARDVLRAEGRWRAWRLDWPDFLDRLPAPDGGDGAAEALIENLPGDLRARAARVSAGHAAVSRAERASLRCAGESIKAGQLTLPFF